MAVMKLAVFCKCLKNEYKIKDFSITYGEMMCIWGGI